MRKTARIMIEAPAVCAALIAVSTATAGGGAEWVQSDAAGPPPRSDHAMAYDSQHGVAVLFGGLNYGANAQTWETDGLTWTQREVDGPSARSDHAMAYDSARGVVVLFGGSIYGYDNGATWEWDGTTWTELNVSGPGSRAGHAMAYDSARGVVVLFGGNTYGYGSDSGATWEWDGDAWTNVHDGDPDGMTAPTPRSGHAMTYDSARGVVVLFGGSEYGYDHHGDTWEWDGITWTIVHDGDPDGVTAPTPRSDHAMAYDSARGVTVLFGGDDTGYQLSGETWEWNGAAWTAQDAAGPSARSRHAMTYDTAHEEMILFGGIDDYYQANGETWKYVATGDGKDPIPGDLNLDGTVDITDLLMLLSEWGPCASCASDLNSDRFVNMQDLLQLLANWG